MLTQSQEENVGFEYLKIASEMSEFPALINDEMTVSFAQLASVSVAFAHAMKSYGVSHDSIVAINTKDTLVSLATLIATSLLGSRWVEAGRILAQSKAVRPTHFFRSPEASGSRKVNFVVMDGSWAPDQNQPTEPDKFPFAVCEDKEAAWLIVKTSGTTGTPKYLELNNRTVFARSKAVNDDFVPGVTKFSSLFSCTAYPFITRAIASLINGCTIVDSRDISLWQKVGVNLVMGSPRQVSELLSGSRIRPKIPQVHIAGSVLNDELSLELLTNFTKVVDVYASTETNRSFKNIKCLDEDGNLTTTGEAVDSTVEIIDDNDNLCSPGESGVVRVTNPYLAKGYLNNPSAAAKAFRGNWFYPGDVASWGENGELNVSGRVDDVANFGGVKIDMRLVDTILKSIDGVEGAVCFENPKPGGSGELLALIQISERASPLDCIEKAKLECLVKLGKLATPKRISITKEIPLTEEGRPHRTYCQNLVLERRQTTN
jgi:acyl-coenzyme A synthetase/AMP-(fatty) acid ligase